MKAVQVRKFGGENALFYEAVDDPIAGDGQVVVDVAAAGVNFVDIYQRRGWYPRETPFILGLEAAGTVSEVGSGVEDVSPGQRVAFCMTPGSYAERVAVKAETVVPLPDDISFEQGAGLMIQGLTAHYLACDTYALTPGDTALVHAAAGGVGALLVQIAKKRGARVIGTISSETKARIASEAGADAVIRYTEEDFGEAVERLTDGEGVEVVYDSVGKDTFERSLDCLKPRGYLVLYGQASGPVGPVDPQVLNQKGSLFLTRPSLGDYIATREELRARANDLFLGVQRGELTVRIDRSFPLSEAKEAHSYMEERRTLGKVVLIP